MSRKEVTTKEDIMTVIDILENAEITYWIDGGWGVDILAGKQTRDHRDIDINFDSRYTEKLFPPVLESILAHSFVGFSGVQYGNL